jgi:hypothetical protein
MKVMVSSRCNDPFPRDGGERLSVVRQKLKDELDAAGAKSPSVWNVRGHKAGQSRSYNRILVLPPGLRLFVLQVM